MSSIKACANTAGELIGLRGEVAVLDKTTNTVMNTTLLTKMGTVPLDLSGCDEIRLNVTNGEFVSKFAVVYTELKVTKLIFLVSGKPTL